METTGLVCYNMECVCVICIDFFQIYFQYRIGIEKTTITLQLCFQPVGGPT